MRRRDRNRLTALKTYYQRKAEKQQREAEAAMLRADSRALQALLEKVQSCPRAGALARPMLLAGAAAVDILASIAAAPSAAPTC